jgi:hypothetical protein
MQLEDKLTELGIFTKRDHSRYRITGTSFVYYPDGRYIKGPNGTMLSDKRWWKRCDDRVLRPVSIDTVLAELPRDRQDVMIWNLNKFRY